jgi:hypothetical protein
VVLVDDSGRLQVKLVDFGLAKSLANTGSEEQRLTATGQVFGTPYYMSPEQCLGKDVDARSDIYSFGCTLYEMIMGEPPFRGANALATVNMHLNDRVPSCAGACPDSKTGQSLDALIARTMAKKPQDRYGSMADVHHDLERIRQQKEIGRPATSVFSGQQGQNTFTPGETAGNASRAESGNGLRRGVIIGGTCTVLLVALAFAFHGIYSAASPTSKVALSAAPAGQEVTQSGAKSEKNQQRLFALYDAADENAEDYLKDPRVAQAREAFACVKKIKVDISGGKKTIHFPAYPIGYVGNHGQLAQNLVHADTSEPLSLTVDWSKEPGTMANPGIFAAIDDDLFGQLFIESPGFLHSGRADKLVSTENEALVQLLHAATKWNKLSLIKMHGFSAISDDRAFDELDKMKHLTIFSARGGDLSMEQLSKHKFLLGVNNLDLERSDEIDFALKKLSASKLLEVLGICHTNPSPSALAGLAACPNLHYLFVEHCHLTSEHIEAICRLPSVRQIRLTKTPSFAHDLEILSKAKQLKEVALCDTREPGPEMQRIKHLYPFITFAEETKDVDKSKVEP